MNKNTKIRLATLNIFLLKADSLADPKKLNYHSYLRDSLAKVPATGIPSLPNGALWIDSRPTAKPGWLLFLEDLHEDFTIFPGASTAAVVFTTVDSAVFAIAFGRGRSLLRLSCWEEGFGLKSALGLVDPDRLRSIDKKRLAAIIQHSRVQTALPGKTGEFGMDVEQDMMRAVAGQPVVLPEQTENIDRSDPGLPLEAAIYGSMDSLVVSARVKLRQVPALLKRYNDAFNNKGYTERFLWIDNISEVSDRERISALNAEIDRRLADIASSELFLVVPELVDWREIRGFSYTEAPDEQQICDALDLESFAATTEGPLTLRMLRTRNVFAISIDADADEQGRMFHRFRWPLAKCLYGEVKDGAAVYILSSGKWYRVKSEFVAQVNEDADRLAETHLAFPPYVQEDIRAYPDYMDSKKEHFYCKEVARQGPLWKVLDRGNIAHGGGHSELEFCDLARAEGGGGCLVFVKRNVDTNRGPATLSHLFAQGYTSFSTLESDKDFVTKANNALGGLFSMDSENLNLFRAVFLIISTKTGRPSEILPFFSRLNLRNTAKNLKRMGVHASVAFAATDEKPLTRTQRKKAKRPK